MERLSDPVHHQLDRYRCCHHVFAVSLYRLINSPLYQHYKLLFFLQPRFRRMLVVNCGPGTAPGPQIQAAISGAAYAQTATASFFACSNQPGCGLGHPHAMSAPSTSGRASSSATPLLRFLDPWELCTTSDNSLEKNPHISSGGSFSLEFFREIDALRRSTCMKQSPIKDFPTTEHLKHFEDYLAHVRQLVIKVEQTKEFKYNWNSPLSGKPKTHQYKLTGMALEQSMAAFMLGSAMRAAAYLLTVAASGGDDGEGPLPAAAAAAAAESAESAAAGPLADAATLLRKAAGLYTWLSERLLKQWSVADALPPERPPELLPSMSSCMRLLCLAEAQAVTAHRAGQRGTKAGLTSALHLAASDLFEQAAKELRDHAGDFPSLSDRLRRFLAISATLQRARAQQWWGDELREQGQAGQGEACCMEAAVALKECVQVTEGHASWKHALQAELACVEEFRRRCEKDRTSVYYQVISKPASSVPAAGKVLVTPVEYKPATLGAGAGAEGAVSGLDLALE